MIVHTRILRTDGTITAEAINATRYRIASNALVVIGTRLRAADPTIAAIKSDETGNCYLWTGHYTREHMAAICAAPSGW